MGWSKDYPDSEWPRFKKKGQEGFPKGAKCTYKDMAWETAAWSPGNLPPGDGDPAANAWRLKDELYDLTSEPHKGPVNIACYVPTWRKAEQYLENTEQFNHMTHAIVAFLMFDESGGFRPDSVRAVEETIVAFRDAARDRDVRLMVAVGGTTDYEFRRLCEKGGASAEDPAFVKMCENVAGFVREHQLEGVGLDLACWWDEKGAAAGDLGGRSIAKGPHAAGTGLVHLAGFLRKGLPSPDYTVSCAVPATAWYGNNFDAKGLSRHVEWIGVMTHDFTGARETSPCGPHSETLRIKRQKDYLGEQQGEWPSLVPDQGGPGENPILSVEDSVWYYSNPHYINWQGKGPGHGVPRNKIAVGVPCYGYNFSYGEESDRPTRQGPPGYRVERWWEIVEDYGPSRAMDGKPNIKDIGETERPAFRKGQPGTYPFKNNVWFETPSTATAKLEFAKGVGIGTVIVWDVSDDDWWTSDASIVKALYKASGHPEKPLAGTVPAKPRRS
ncbi:glycoside hydrolase family 18 protein [Streptomyces sp. NPDC059989]|uniref:glycoside hydrolase family 18 protein n=1 Tax=Streptomyces sp. NPDC059989 TaxID=3347026 RepID=UPI0036925780